MLGFGKKKKPDKQKGNSAKNDLPAEPAEETAGDQPEPQNEPEKKAPLKKKSGLPIRRVMTILLVLMAVCISAYIVYLFYFTPKDANRLKATYQKIELKHVNLPEEMLRFSFDYFPDLYGFMITFNHEIDLFDKEIARIDAIAQKYPDQAKIADKEKKTWEKAKNTLQKAFLKIEKPVKEIFVLFRVNTELGMAQIETKNTELTELAKEALTPAQELTQKIHAKEKIPEGLLKGTFYKLKKKFL